MGGGDGSASGWVSNPINEGWSTVGAGFTDVMGEITGSRATEAAMHAQTQAADAANATQRYIYDTSRQDLAPWRQAGTRALKDLQSGDFQRDFTAADFQADPGYQFRLSEGMKALEGSAAARGALNSGATLKALTRYNQDFATNEYQNVYNRFNADQDRRFNRLASLAGIGQTANSQMGQAGQNYGNNVSQTQMGVGNAIASANIAQSNRNAGLIGQGAMAGAMYMASDRRLKQDIKPVAQEDLAELKATITPYLFKYADDIHGEGEWVGVMAQDLQKSKLGRSLVVEDTDGHLKVDLKKLASAILATMAEAS